MAKHDTRHSKVFMLIIYCLVFEPFAPLSFLSLDLFSLSLNLFSYLLYSEINIIVSASFLFNELVSDPYRWTK